jgi:hypothetical protein
MDFRTLFSSDRLVNISELIGSQQDYYDYLINDRKDFDSRWDVIVEYCAEYFLGLFKAPVYFVDFEAKLINEKAVFTFCLPFFNDVYRFDFTEEQFKEITKRFEKAGFKQRTIGVQRPDMGNVIRFEYIVKEKDIVKDE